MKRYLCSLVLLLLLCLPLKVSAAPVLAGHYVDQTGAVITVLLANDGRARINLDEEVYFLLDTGHIWTISMLDEGQWAVMDFVERTTTAVLENPAILQKYTRVTIKPTEYVRKIAGYDGKVFEVSVRGTGEVYPLVVTSNRDVVRLSKVVMVFFQDMNQGQGRRDVMEILNSQYNSYYGVLSLDAELTLRRVEHRDYPESYFDLPKELR